MGSNPVLYTPMMPGQPFFRHLQNQSIRQLIPNHLRRVTGYTPCDSAEFVDFGYSLTA
jgi:hypothetical protein